MRRMPCSDCCALSLPACCTENGIETAASKSLSPANLSMWRKNFRVVTPGQGYIVTLCLPLLPLWDEDCCGEEFGAAAKGWQ